MKHENWHVRLNEEYIKNLAKHNKKLQAKINENNWLIDKYRKFNREELGREKE